MTAAFEQLLELRTSFGGLAIMAATIRKPHANSAVANRASFGVLDFAQPEPLAA